MKINVRLKDGEDPKTWDESTGEEITRVAEIIILPHRKATATLFALDGSGKKQIGLDGKVAKESADIVRIEGTWTAAE